MLADSTPRKLDSSQFAQLQDGLVDAFRKPEDLYIMVRRKLDLNLHSIVKQAPLREMTYDLISWAEENGKVPELVEGAYAEKPQNSLLKRFYDSYHASISSRSTQVGPVCPYRGLEAFRVEDALYYRGRDRMIGDLVRGLDTCQFVALLGPSGSGKTSLLQAGLVSRLQEREPNWEAAVFTPGRLPLHRLAAPLVDWLQPGPPRIDRMDEVDRLVKRLADGGNRTLLVWQQLLEFYPDKLFLLVADQFEELYVYNADSAVRQAFIGALVQAVGYSSKLRVVISMRIDLSHHLWDDERLVELTRSGLVHITPLTREELRQVIEVPAKAVQPPRTYADGLVDRILDDLAGEPGNLPLLEFSLRELWDKQTGQGELTHQAYVDIGKVTGAIAQRAEDEYSKLEQQGDAVLLRSIFTRLVIPSAVRPGIETKDTRCRVLRDDLNRIGDRGRIWQLVEDLARARLVVIGRDPVSGASTVEIAHEALIWNWRRLQEWIDSDRDFLAWRKSILSPRLEAWLTHQKSDDALLTGLALVEARRWLQEGRRTDFNRSELDYVFHSILADRSVDLAEWLPKYGDVSETVDFLERDFLGNDHADERAKGAAAMRCVPRSDLDLRIYKNLESLVLEDASKQVRQESAHTILARGQIQSLVKLLDSRELPSKQRDRLIRALVHVRNVAGTGVELKYVLHKDRTRILLRANWDLVWQYRVEFAIALLVTYLIGQPFWQVISYLTQFDLDTINPSMMIVFSIGLCVVVRKQVNDGQSITFLNLLEIGFCATLLSDFSMLMEFMDIDWTNNFRFLLAYISRISVNWLISSLIACITVLNTYNFTNGAKVLTIALLASTFRIVFNLEPSVYYGYFQLPHFDYNDLVSVLVNTLAIFPFLWGFQRGLRSAFGDSLNAPLSRREYLLPPDAITEPSLETQTKLFFERLVATFTLRRALVMFGTIAVFVAILFGWLSPPHMFPLKCSLLRWAGSTGAVNVESTFLRHNPTLASSGYTSISCDECLVANGRSMDGQWMHVGMADGRTGWVQTGDVSWAMNPSAVPAVTTVRVMCSQDDWSLFWNLAWTYNGEQHKTSGGSTILVQVLVEPTAFVTDSEIDEVMPTAWIPASSMHLRMADTGWRSTHGRNLFQGEPISLLHNPLVVAMSRPRAEALGWPDRPIGWLDILEIATSENGWGKYGYPEWGVFKLGSKPPIADIEGLATQVSLAYVSTHKQLGMTIADLSHLETIDFMKAFNESASYYSSVDPDPLDLLEISSSPLSGIVVSEDLVIQRSFYLSTAGDRPPVVAIYPKEGSFCYDYPYAILDSPWVTPEQIQAAQDFRDYLLREPQQQRAANYGYRPANDVAAPGFPFDLEHGISTSQARVVFGIPSAEVVTGIRALWLETRRPVDVALAIDMPGDVEESDLEPLWASLVTFTELLGTRSQVRTIVFSDTVTLLPFSSALGRQSEFPQQLSRLVANGDTKLLDALILAYDELEDRGDGDHLQAVVILTDGRDSTSSNSLEQVMWRIRHARDDGSDNIRFFAIAYGSDPDVELLTRLSEATGGRILYGRPDNITDVFVNIAAILLSGG